MSTVFIEADPVPEEFQTALDVCVGCWYEADGLPVKVRALRTYLGQRQAEIGMSFRAVWYPCSLLSPPSELLGRLNTERLREGPAAHPTRRGAGMEAR